MATTEYEKTATNGSWETTQANSSTSTSTTSVFPSTNTTWTASETPSTTIIWTTSGTPSTTTTQPPTHSNVTLILLCIFVPLSLICLGLLIYYLFYHQKKGKKFGIRDFIGERAALARRVSSKRKRRRLSYHPMATIEFNSQFQGKENRGEIEEEYELLKNYGDELLSTKSLTIGSSSENRGKNRFVDIIPYDDTLVQLQHKSGSPPTNYINASFINGYKEGQRFIATQGPKKNTVADFWNMVLEQNVSVIVCLTNIVEDGKIKCFQYWPNAQELLHFDELTLQGVSEFESKDGYVVRKMEIAREEEDIKELPEVAKREVTQFHLTSWPDHGVPESTAALRKMCEAFIHFHDTSGTVLVHCSAGVGRTGTFLASLFTMQKIHLTGATEIDLAQEVKLLREQRPKMVQTLGQYKFIYKCIQDFININSKMRINRQPKAQRGASEDVESQRSDATSD